MSLFCVNSRARATAVLSLASLLAACSSSSTPVEGVDHDAGPGAKDDSGGTVTREDAGTSSHSSSSSETVSSSDGGSTVTINGEVVSVARSPLPRTRGSAVPASELSGAVAANNGFALDLYSQLRASSTADNLLTSPISASIALTMTYAGAEKTTATQMATALHYGSAASTIFEGQNALSQALASRAAAALAADVQTAMEGGQPAPSPSDYELQIVNAVWGQKAYTWSPPFLAILAQDYGTGVYQQDFVHAFDPARLLINDWVADETSGRIENLLPSGSLNATTRMVLVNAIHLKLPWSAPFVVGDTANASFTNAESATVTAPFMNQTTNLPYTDDGEAQIVGLTLANNQIAVVIALPHGDLATYEAGLTTHSAGIAMPTGDALVQLSVPKVAFTSPTFSLAGALKKMGMPIAFIGGSADFTGLCASPPDGGKLFISDVLQKAMIAMQETGVEAAAATAVIIDAKAGGACGSCPAPVPIPMIVNRPFVMSIVDVPTGALLFLGHIGDPTQTGGG